MQHSSRHRWLWHAVYAAAIVALGYGVYSSSRRIDYDWHWERIPQYVLSHAGQRVAAPADGVAHPGADGHSLAIASQTDPPIVTTLDRLSRVTVHDGDLVFAGDTVALREGWVAGPLL